MLDNAPRTDDLPRHCTFEPADWRILARHWYPVAELREVEDKKLVGAVLLDEKLVVYKVDETVVVANDICTHRGVPLTLGSNPDSTGVRCAYHGLQFGKNGRCVKVPAHPDGAIPNKLHLKSYPVEIRYGLVWTCLRPEEGETAPKMPLMPHWDEAGFQQINVPPFDIAGFAGRQVEGFLDVAHFAFIHTETFADPDNPVVPPYVAKPTDYGFEVEYWSTVGNYPSSKAHLTPKDYQWLRHFRCSPPFTAHLTVHFPDGGKLSILNAASPISARKTRLFCPIARNFDTHLPVQDVYDFNHKVFAEDAGMVEQQKPENLPLDPRLEAHIPADLSSINYRRSLRDMGLSHFFIA
ncbi:(2Fe-2S)-binding protein [Kaistia sp. 32K]|nr:(2Fe-2S)-binding protein [Kaistia sp. 32K]